MAAAAPAPNPSAPIWVREASDCFVKDSFARQCFGGRFLYTGREPRLDDCIELQVTETSGVWYRMSGKVTAVHPAPSDAEIHACQPPSLFFKYGREAVKQQYGAVHGQRISALVRLNVDFYHRADITPTLDQVYEVVLICNDNKENMWLLESMHLCA